MAAHAILCQYLKRVGNAGERRGKPPAILSSAFFLLGLLATGVLGGLLTVALPSVQAMGQAPTTCDNRYDGTITSFLVTYPGGSLNPLANPNGTFTLYGNSTYSVSFTIHTQAQSSKGNTLSGTAWYNENLFGYYFGACYPNSNSTSVGPNADVNISVDSITHPCCSGYTVYQINFSTFSQLQQPVGFRVNWQPEPSTTSLPATTTSTSTAASSTLASTNATSTFAAATASQRTSFLSVDNTTSTLTSTQSVIALAGLTSSLPASGSLQTTSSQTATAAAANHTSHPSLSATDILTATGVGVVMAYAIGWAMIRRLK